MFIVDTSGSNSEWSDSSGTQQCQTSDHSGCIPPSDPRVDANNNPRTTFRGGSITDFFNIYSSKTNFSWGFTTFADSANPMISTGGKAVFSDKTAMAAAITTFNGLSDTGGTDYAAALAAAQNAISQDPDLNATGAKQPLYVVIFASDGYPDDPSAVAGSLTSLMNVAPGRVMVSSIYYGTEDNASAHAILGDMVENGGVFVDVDTTSVSEISIQDLIKVQSCN